MIAQSIRALFNTIGFYDDTLRMRGNAEVKNWDVLISTLHTALCSVGFSRQDTIHPEWIEDRIYYMSIAAFCHSHECDSPHILVYHELRDMVHLIDCSTVTSTTADVFITDLNQYLDQYKLQVQNT